MASTSEKKKDSRKFLATNKKAYRDYELIDRFEAGMALLGTEVKSLRNSQAELAGSYARVENGQCWLVGAKIAQYQQTGIANHKPDRKRKLLLNKAEIRKIKSKLELRGFSLIPLRMYFNDRGLAKIEIALARGKRQYDKRRSIEQRQQKKDITRNTKKYRR
ncbi:MAG: SsrA-binding protein SmpB [Sedimentisphaerales bacterium]|nr:SsrA-binding protein SmpB [Sedimentisphaerales bacterium]